jgi:hypothetical protein
MTTIIEHVFDVHTEPKPCQGCGVSTLRYCRNCAKYLCENCQVAHHDPAVQVGAL